MSKTKQPWDQQPEEPDKWFSRFLIFLNLGTTRSVPKAEAVALNRKKRNPAAGSWVLNARKWKWYERANDFDIAQSQKVTNSIESDMEAHRNGTAALARAIVEMGNAVCKANSLPEVQLELQKLKALVKMTGTVEATCNFHRTLHGEKHSVKVEDEREIDWSAAFQEPTK